MTKEILKGKINEYKNDQYMKIYINCQLKKEENNEDDEIFSSNNLMQDLMNSEKLAHILLTEYSFDSNKELFY